MTNFDDIDVGYLRQAVNVSQLAPLKMTAFSVGSILVGKDRALISTGYSRELGEDWHAEAVAMEKARRQLALDRLTGFTLYSSLEPCSERKSGKRSCCSLILDQSIARVVFGLREPPIFVNGKGAETLRATGIEVVELDLFNCEVISINAHLPIG